MGFLLIVFFEITELLLNKAYLGKLDNLMNNHLVYICDIAAISCKVNEVEMPDEEVEVNRNKNDLGEPNLCYKKKICFKSP